MAIYKLDSGATNASHLIINAINRLRQAKDDIAAAEALIGNMTDAEVLLHTGLTPGDTGNGTALQGLLASADTALADPGITNLTENLLW